MNITSKYLKYTSSTSTIYEVIGTPYTIDTTSGIGHYRYYKTKKVHSPYYSEETRVGFEEVFDNSPEELQEYFLFNLDIFKNKIDYK